MATILLTPGGTGMAITTIQAFRADGDHRIVTTDVDQLSPGLHLADRGYLVPRFDDPEYFPAVLDIVEREGVDVVFPAFDGILMDFAARRADLESRGANLAISPIETLRTTQDKWQTVQALEGTVPMPDSAVSLDDVDASADWFVKPRRGSGSEDAYRAVSWNELEFYFERIEDPIVQSYLPGSEFTIDCFPAPDGGVATCVPRHRHEITDGISTKVTVTRYAELDRIADRIADALEFVGPFFFQVREDADGTPKLIEIGARLAGTMCHRFVTPSLQQATVVSLLDGHVPSFDVAYGRSMSRYWAETYFDDPGDAVVTWPFS